MLFVLRGAVLSAAPTVPGSLVDSAHSPVQEIDDLSGVPALTSLWLGRNKIGALNGLDAVPSLQQLGLQSNRLTTLGAGLAPVVGLRELYVSHNGLTSLEGIGHLVRLARQFLCVRVLVEGRSLFGRIGCRTRAGPGTTVVQLCSIGALQRSEYSRLLCATLCLCLVFFFLLSTRTSARPPVASP